MEQLQFLAKIPKKNNSYLCPMGEQIQLTAEEFQAKLKSDEIVIGKKNKLSWKEMPKDKVDLPKPKKPSAIKKDKVDLFIKLITQELKVQCIPEYKFCPERKWRADYFIPEINCIVEVEGGIWASAKGEKSRHFTGTGATADMEKYNKMTELGFKLIRVVPNELLTKGFTQIERIIQNAKANKT